MNIYCVASEFAPYAKIGGLADVTFGLCRSLSEQNHQITLILPFYAQSTLTSFQNLKKEELPFFSFFKGSFRANTLWKGYYGNLNVILIEPTDLPFFKGKGIYERGHELEHFIYFSKVAADYIRQLNTPPDVVHLHDWPTSIICALLPQIPTVLTIHNLAYQGIVDPSLLEAIQLPLDIMMRFDYAQDPKLWEKANLLKAGIVSCTQLTTVSPSYAQEILTPLGGQGLHEILIFYRSKLSGILNGIDTNYWNTNNNPHLFASYSDLELRGKLENKHNLQQTLKLDCINTFMGCAVSRLTEQKSPELIHQSLLHIKQSGGQFILLGKCSDDITQKKFEDLAHEYRQDRSIRIFLEHDEGMAHKVFAASDAIVIPSLFEPCGLTQMIGFRYGTIPIVRETGGLKDTVCYWTQTPHSSSQCRGFSFFDPKETIIKETISKALELYHDNPIIWRSLIQEGMRGKFGWEDSSVKFLECYQKAIGQKNHLTAY